MTEYHVSPSQVDGALHCMRRWGWRYIAGIPGPTNKYAARGSGVHQTLENWLLKAQAPDLSTEWGKIAYSALPHLPQPMTPGLEVERAHEREFDGVLWVYRKDWRLRDQTSGGIVVGDHKTCSNPDRYGHDPIGVLDREAQPILYAFDELYDGAPWVQLRWTDMTTSKPFRTVPQILNIGKMQPGPQTVSARHVVDMFKAWNEFGRNLLQIRKKGVHPIKLTYDAGHCQAYGSPCPYKSHCNLSQSEEMRSLMSTAQAQVPNDAQGFLARLAQMSNTAAQVAQAPAPTPEPPQVQVPPTPPAPQVGFTLPGQSQQDPGLAPPVAVMGGVPVFTPPPGLTPVNQGFQFPPLAAPMPAMPSNEVPPPPVAAAPVEIIQTTIAPTTGPGSGEAPVKRKRRTKAEIESDQARLAQEQEEQDQQEQAEVLAGHIAHPPTVPAPAPNPNRAFRQDLVLAMAANAGYAALDSVSLAGRLEVLMSLAGGDFE